MEKSLSDLKKFIELTESTREKLVLEPLPYGREDLEPVMSKQTIDYHYGKLAQGYVDRYNHSEGDNQFNQAGAFLHNIFFPQLKSPTDSNKPNGVSQEFIDKKFGNFDDMKAEFKKTAMAIQGSGWVYLARNGSIKTIVNHEIRSDIILLIDWWEHAWSLDYQADKAKYLKSIWKIINWSVINDRINLTNIK
jgi:Fe-Mn family superoxide dismutase